MNSTITEQLSIQRKKTSKLSIASITLGILSQLYFYLGPNVSIYRTHLESVGQALITFITPVISTTAVTLGAISIYEIVKPQNIKGIILSIIGIISGGLIVGFYVLMLLFFTVNS